MRMSGVKRLNTYMCAMDVPAREFQQRVRRRLRTKRNHGENRIPLTRTQKCAGSPTAEAVVSKTTKVEVQILLGTHACRSTKRTAVFETADGGLTPLRRTTEGGGIVYAVVLETTALTGLMGANPSFRTRKIDRVVMCSLAKGRLRVNLT